jgi:metal-responsive CopG/Arc/MetJ family transcriptional regulator
MTNTTATAFRFSDEDLELLDLVQRHMGLRSRTEALRAAIRHYVRTEGLEAKRKRAPKLKS